MKAVSIVGFKDTGKSTLAVALAHELKQQGMRVASIKHSAHGFDKKGTDTSRMLEHCSAVVGISPHETFISWPEKLPLADMLPLLQADVLLVEGGKNLTWLPRVLCNQPDNKQGRKALRPHLAIAETNLDELKSPSLPSLIKNLAQTICNRGFVLPGLDCKECGMPDCETMSAAIVAGTRTIEDCKARKARVKVSVNGTPIPMGGFIEDIVSSTIRGLLSQLKGYSPGEITIRLP
jgi:molybdopterin-guanine dinucleotide biosynthesis protein B